MTLHSKLPDIGGKGRNVASSTEVGSIIEMTFEEIRTPSRNKRKESG